MESGRFGWVSVAVAVAVLVLGGCAAEGGSGAAPATSTAQTATAQRVAADAQASDEPDADELTPLLVSHLGAPIPFTGSDGLVHLVYELEILNAGPRDATLHQIATVDASGAVLQTIDGDQVVERTVPVGPLLTQPEPVTDIAAGATAVVLMDDTYATVDEVPDRFGHQISATFAAPSDGSHPFASQYPDELTLVTDLMAPGDGQPVVIGPPLAGDGWLAMNGCCSLSSHRGAMLPLAGRLNASERFAIDWVRINPELAPDDLGDDLLPTFAGDPTQNTSYLAYDQPLLAVADGTVVAVVDDMPDATPQALTEGLTVEQLGGNYVILDIGDGLYAFYAHVKQGSFSVSVGDRVTRGQEIGRLGNTGNSSEAHLHFHVSRAPVPLASTQWPYEIEAFTVTGTLGGDRTTAPSPADGPHERAMPLALDVVDFGS